MDILLVLVRSTATGLTVLIFVRVLLSWINPGRHMDHPLAQLVYRITEPLLAPVRQILPTVAGVDFSPLVVLFGIQLAEQLLLHLLSMGL